MQLDSKLPLPKLGLAQISVLQGEPINAVSILENVLADVPQWIDALQVSCNMGGVHVWHYGSVVRGFDCGC